MTDTQSLDERRGFGPLTCDACGCAFSIEEPGRGEDDDGNDYCPDCTRDAREAGDATPA